MANKDLGRKILEEVCIMVKGGLFDDLRLSVSVRKNLHFVPPTYVILRVKLNLD
jgi:hypothetical protein